MGAGMLSNIPGRSWPTRLMYVSWSMLMEDTLPPFTRPIANAAQKNMCLMGWVVLAVLWRVCVHAAAE